MTHTDHPLTEARAAELWEVHIPERKTHYLGWQSFPEPSRRYFTAIIRAAFDAGREHERKHADPHHDARYVPCGPEFHYQEPGGRRGIWDRQTGEVAWFSSSEDSPAFLTRLAERIDMGVDSRGEWTWSPAPTPPAEEVELPTEFGAVITDVSIFGSIAYDYVSPRLVRVVDSWFDDDEDGWTSEHITAFTLPDGTRARRDGDHEDGTPRFVKETHNDRP